jgi:uncharacterized repeat protein (TIGR02543 family)
MKKIKRALSLIMAAAMIFSLLCVPASAASAGELTVLVSSDDVAQTGQNITFRVWVSGTQGDIGVIHARLFYDSDKLQFVDAVNGEFGEQFTGGKTVSDESNTAGSYVDGLYYVDGEAITTPTQGKLYEAIFKVTASNPGNVAPTLVVESCADGKGTAYDVKTEQTYAVVPITTFAVKDLDAPVIGKTPDTTFSIIPDGMLEQPDGLTATVKWLRDASIEMQPDETFAPSTTYWAEIDVKLEEEKLAFISDLPDLTDYTVQNSTYHATLRGIFQTPELQVTGIEITKAPDKMTYVEGEEFDTTGMVVTATYDNGSTAAVTGYTVEPEIMNAGTSSVTVSYSGKTYVLNGIKVLKRPTAGDFNITLPTDLTYDGTAKDAVVTASAGMGDFTVKYNGSEDAPINAGSYAVTIDVTAGTEYGALEGIDAGSFTIAKAAPGITAPDTVSVSIYNSTEVAVSAAFESDKLTFESRDNSIATVSNENGKVTVTGVKTGEAVITVKHPGSDNVLAGEKSINVTVTALPTQELSFEAPGDKTVVYGAAGFQNKANNATTNGGQVTYKSSNENVAKVDAAGNVAIIGAGQATITATAAGVENTYAPTSVSYTITVEPKSIDGAAVVLEKDVFMWEDGLVAEPAVTSVTVGGTVIPADSYTVSYADNDKIGTATATVTAKGNYTGTASKTFTITDSGYSFTVTAKDKMVVGEVDSTASATLTGTDTAISFNKALIKVKVTGPEGSKPQIIANDGHNDYNLAEVGQWGPDSGFPVNADYNAVTALKLSFDMPGEYTAEFSLVDLENGEKVLCSGSETITVTDAFSFEVNSPEAMVRGQIADAEATMLGDANAPTYENALIMVEVEGPEGSNPQIIANDGYNDYNLAEIGYWGPKTGFKVYAGYNETTPLKLSFDKAGTYTNTLTLIDVKTQKVLGTASDTITVTDAFSFNIDAPDTMVRGRTGDATATLIGDANAPERTALIKVGVTGPEGAKPQILATDTDGKEWNLAEIGQWGPDTGFTVGASYNVPTALKLSFDKAGEYTAVFELVEIGTGEVLASGSKTITVKNPSSGGGGGSSSATFTLSFNTNGGSKLDNVSEDKGTVIDLDKYVPTREGYSFGGWYSDKELTEKLSSVTLTKDTTVYAKWIEKSIVFDDVSAAAYYSEAVDWAISEGITIGTSDNTFSPDMTCTRAQAVTFLWRALGCPEPENAENPFVDVADDLYYSKAVLWAVEQGIVKGTSDTTFSPDMLCSRAHIVTLIWRAAGSPEAGTAVNPFEDVAEDVYYSSAVLWAIEEKLTTGTTDTTFSPEQDCTRAQIVTFLWRYMV